MTSSIKSVCAAYLDAWRRKDIKGIAACLHPDVRFKSPNAETIGRDNYVTGALRFFSMIDRLETRAEFFSTDGAMFAHDFICIAPIGKCPTAELVLFKNDLIRENEIFFDARPFEAFARAQAAARGKPT